MYNSIPGGISSPDFGSVNPSYNSQYIDYSKVVASDVTSLFIKSKRAWGCGKNDVGQVTPGSTGSSASYHQIVAGYLNSLDVVDVVSNGRSTYWILADGRVFAHGDNTYGQLGNVTSSATGDYCFVDFH
jgi:alpha-tubulin suppressor-like RCC1 family protein